MFHKKNIYIFSIALIILLFLFSLSFFSTNITKTLAANHLLPEPETFTELYFNNHQSLPSKVTPLKKYSFSFTVNNLEYKLMSYPYEVSIEHENKKIQTISKKTLVLPQNEKKVIKIDFTAPEFASKAAVVVNLVKKEQAIHFWIYE